MFEPIIKTDLSTLPQRIETNLDDLNPFITEKVERAKSLVVNVTSLEEVEAAEADAALLTKLAKKVSRFRLDWVAVWNQPFESVIAKCKDYERRLNDAATDLRGKAKDGRDLVRAKVCDTLAHEWGKLTLEAFDGAEYPWFAEFFATMTNEKTTGCWTNRGKKLEKVIEEMRAELKRCADALATIQATYAAESAGVLSVAVDALGKRFDIPEAINAVNAYKAQQARAAEAERIAAERAAAAKAEAEAETTIVVASGKMVECPMKTHDEERVLVTDAPIAGAKVESYRLEVTGTRADLVALRRWGEAHGITFRNLDK